jgi:hypothetical protein
VSIVTVRGGGQRLIVRLKSTDAVLLEQVLHIAEHIEEARDRRARVSSIQVYTALNFEGSFYKEFVASEDFTATGRGKAGVKTHDPADPSGQQQSAVEKVLTTELMATPYSAPGQQTFARRRGLRRRPYRPKPKPQVTPISFALNRETLGAAGSTEAKASGAVANTPQWGASSRSTRGRKIAAHGFSTIRHSPGSTWDHFTGGFSKHEAVGG